MAIFSKKEVYTVSEVAELLHLHPNSVYRAVRSGSLPAYKIGIKGTYRIPGEAVEALKSKYLRKPGPKPKKKEEAAE